MTLCGPWATDADIACGPCVDLDGIGDLDGAILIASETLYNLTDHAYPGICEDTIRPPSRCGCRWPIGDWSNYADAWNLGGRFGRCRCDHVDAIDLPGWPAVDVTQVLIDGAAVDPLRYRIDNHRQLVFQPDYNTASRRHWPMLQRGDRPATDPFTWQVTYIYGTAPPPGGVEAAVVLACEYAMSRNPDLRERCRLPKNTVSSTRKNNTVAIADPTELLRDGLTGIPEVDLWIRSDRWGRQHQGATVFTGNRGRTRRKTSP